MLFKVINLPEADFVLSVCVTKVLNKMSTEYISLSKDEYYFELQSDKNLTTFNYAWLIQMPLRDLQNREMWFFFRLSSYSFHCELPGCSVITNLPLRSLQHFNNPIKNIPNSPNWINHGTPDINLWCLSFSRAMKIPPPTLKSPLHWGACSPCRVPSAGAGGREGGTVGKANTVRDLLTLQGYSFKKGVGFLLM